MKDINSVERHQTELDQVRGYSVGARMTTNDLEITRTCGQIDMLPGSDFPSTRRMLNQLDPSNPGSRDDAAAPVCSERLIRHSTLGGTRPDLGQSGSILARKRRIHTQFNELQEYYLYKRREWGKNMEDRGYILDKSLILYEEHEKRAWTVDFSRSEPSWLVSGSVMTARFS